MIEFLIKQIEAVEKNIKALQEHAESLRSMLEKETPKKWSPVGGEWFINQPDGAVEHWKMSTVDTRDAGLERPTEKQADRAFTEMRRFNRLLALRDELCGDDVVDWTGHRKEKHYVYFTYDHKRWCISENVVCESVTPYFTSRELAQRACDMLNSGEVEL